MVCRQKKASPDGSINDSLLRVTLGQGNLIRDIHLLISRGAPIFLGSSASIFPESYLPPENFFSQWGALINGHVLPGNPKIMSNPCQTGKSG